MSTDRIEKTVVLKAPRSRVWRAIADYSGEPTTLVEFHFEDTPGGTRLTVIESGFDRIPLARRAEAFRNNEAGWAEQIKNIERHVSS
jgi:uncharacterized protein YndB with AHSA1/START domain